MNELTSERVLAALRQVRHPQRGDDVVSLGMISGVAVKNGNVGFAIEVHPAEAKALEPLRKAAVTSAMVLTWRALAPLVITNHPVMDSTSDTSSTRVRAPSFASAARAAVRERQKQCGEEWREAKKAGKIEKNMTWPKYWSACNARLKAKAG